MLDLTYIEITHKDEDDDYTEELFSPCFMLAATHSSLRVIHSVYKLGHFFEDQYTSFNLLVYLAGAYSLKYPQNISQGVGTDLVIVIAIDFVHGALYSLEANG
ncbi:hypothetical protein PROFUN_01865 [Planoprotostelium fungivorum]|uniref:Uncharacterized protein n=1 Tax=Planoprotostelium fungivorum TaxID=1890364 RepID=A0A2P6NYW4_9EUKA|nr:hypothetical protein PROFUN_01865 [Planoprotostelium fungivorum]